MSANRIPPRLRHNQAIAQRWLKEHSITSTEPPVSEQLESWTLNTPHPNGYNPSILRIGASVLMVYRYHPTGSLRTKLASVKFDANMALSDAKDVPMATENSCEDPKLFAWPDGEPWMSWVEAKWPKEIKAVVRYGPLWQNSLQPKFGHNDWSGCEKNWCPFIPEDNPYFIYRTWPMQQVIGVSGNDCSTPIEAPGTRWPWGEIRGGCVIRWGDKLLRFFHSNLDNELGQWRRRYYVGALLMEAVPPFKVLALSTEPILRGSEAPVVECPHFKGNVVFPGGSVTIEGGWLVAVGVNDCRCVLVKVTEKDLKL